MRAAKELVQISEIREKIKEFYDPAVWHFVCINGLFENDELEIQWSFTKIGAKDEWSVLYAKAEADDSLPSVADMLPTARMYEGELRDLLGANFEGSVKGMFIEVDGVENPLRIKR
ncbi:MAG: NADH-quinone oxidoreductase subunit C [Campylobacterales bacterium]